MANYDSSNDDEAFNNGFSDEEDEEEDEESDGDASMSPGQDDDGIGIAMEPEASQPIGTDESKSSNDMNECQVLGPEEVKAEMKTLMDDVATVLRIPLATIRILLNQFKWNKESLLERFYDAGDAEAFFRDAHVISPLASSSSITVSSLQQANMGPCQICFEKAVLMGMACEHRFCHQCWAHYIAVKVMDEGRGQFLCPQLGCDIIVDDDQVTALIKDEKVKKRYNRLIINSFVESNRLLRWCPAADCGSVLKVPHPEARAVVCRCGFKCCFSCGQEWHEPVNCRLLKLWLKKCSDDSETSNWINANTKECPKCGVTIEKDGGCNHMTCKNTACKSEFCWMCLGPWQPHGTSWYSCNRFDDSSAKQARDAQERSRAALQRYLHYYNRFMGHQQSLRLENRLYATVKTKMEQMQALSMSWIEVQFLKKAVDVLSSCRRTLMFTYAFAFYLQRDNQAAIFEGNQGDLEQATEQLSEFLERDIDNENLVTLKQKVQDKFRYVQQRQLVLLKHCIEEADRWQFTA